MLVGGMIHAPAGHVHVNRYEKRELSGSHAMSDTLPDPENPTPPPAEAPPQAPPAAEAPEPVEQVPPPAETAPEDNPEAVKACYLGIASIIPLLGIPLGFYALSLGVKGLKNANRQAVPVGRMQAWIGVMGGGLLAFGQITAGAIILAANAGAFG